MVAAPKPPVRTPKPRKPIKRTPIRPKRSTPRTRKHTCISRGCNRIPTAGVMCLTHAKRKADELWGKAIRKDRCELAALGPCGGPIQACHGLSRGYMGTRYLIENGFSGCAGHNFFAEIRPLEWDTYLRKTWGEEKYGRLRTLALSFGKKGEHVDYEAVIAALRGSEEVS